MYLVTNEVISHHIKGFTLISTRTYMKMTLISIKFSSKPFLIKFAKQLFVFFYFSMFILDRRTPLKTQAHRCNFSAAVE